MPASERRQLNVPLESTLVESLKSRAAEDGVTLGHLVQQLLSSAMEGWTASPSIQTRLDELEQRVTLLEHHALLTRSSH